MELLNSISRQTILPNKTLIVINNFKKNFEQTKIESNDFIKNAPTNIALEVIISNEKGVSKARNIGMDNCKTEYLIYGDDDDLWSENKIELILSQLKRHKVPTLIRHGFVHLKSDGKEIQKKFYNKKIGLRLGAIANYYGGGSTLSGNTSIFKSLRFNENLIGGEDWDFWLRANYAEINISTIEKPLVKYRVHPNRATKLIWMIFKFDLFLRIKYICKSLNIFIFMIVGLIFSSIKFFLKSILLILKINL